MTCLSKSYTGKREARACAAWCAAGATNLSPLAPTEGDNPHRGPSMPTQHRLKLLAHPGFGSAIVEAQLALYDVPFMRVPVGDVVSDPDARSRVAQDNPISQLPTLLVGDSIVITESAAITLWLSEEFGSDETNLVPQPGDALRPEFLRWLIYWVASPYSVFAYLDRAKELVSNDEARVELERALTGRLTDLLCNLEHAAQAPWFMGDRFTALDIYAGVFSEWTPGRDWYAREAPKLVEIASRVWAMPDLRLVYEQNFLEK